MRGFIIRILITTLGLWVAREIVPGIAIAGWHTFLFAAVLLGVVNAIVRPVLVLLTLPLTLLTLGLFLLVVNGISFGLVAWLLPHFSVSGIGAATLGALVVALTGWVAQGFVGDSGKLERRRNLEVRGRRVDDA
ncbi:MAG TPA: phage holin family protein [Gemmatimonadales bacterium]|nr:phage holin family protein [Gemmatimonadales bacterium]